MPTVTRTRRHRVALAGVVLAALVSAACGSSNRTPRIVYITLPPSSPTPTAAGSLPPGVTPGPPAATAASPTITSDTITSAAPDGKWKVTFKKPVIGGIADSVSGSMNDAITQKVNAYISAFTGQDLPAVAAGTGPSTLEGDYAIAYNSPSVVSLRFSVLTNVSGGAHAVGVPGSIDLVVATGKTVALGDLFSDSAKAVATRRPSRTMPSRHSSERS